MRVSRQSLIGAGLAVLVFGLLALYGLHGSAPDSGGAPGVSWQPDLKGAMARAESERKVVMVEFYTDWCTWCRKLNETTFADGDVQKALAQVVAVRLNAEKDGRGQAETFRVEGYPTIVFLDASGREVGRIPGYLPPKPFLQELHDILKRA
jgi:thiol:disulfide interchange protein